MWYKTTLLKAVYIGRKNFLKKLKKSVDKRDRFWYTIKVADATGL